MGSMMNDIDYDTDTEIAEKPKDTVSFNDVLNELKDVRQKWIKNNCKDAAIAADVMIDALEERFRKGILKKLADM